MHTYLFTLFLSLSPTLSLAPSLPLSLPPSLPLSPFPFLSLQVVSPLSTRAQIVKAELSDTEGLKYKLEEKGKEIVELKKAFKLKGQEVGEINTKVDLLEKKLETADAEVRVMIASQKKRVLPNKVKGIGLYLDLIMCKNCKVLYLLIDDVNCTCSHGCSVLAKSKRRKWKQRGLKPSWNSKKGTLLYCTLLYCTLLYCTLTHSLTSSVVCV